MSTTAPRAHAHAHGSWVAARASTRTSPSYLIPWHRHDRGLRGLSSAHPPATGGRLSSVHTLTRARPPITSQTSPLELEAPRVADFELKASQDPSAHIVPIIGAEGFNEWHHISHPPLPLNAAAFPPTFPVSSSSSVSSTEPKHLPREEEEEYLNGEEAEVESELSKRLLSVQVLTVIVFRRLHC